MLQWVNTSYFRKRLVQIGKIFGYFNIFKRSRVTPYDKIRNRPENGRYTLSNRGDVACSDNTCHDIVPRLVAFFTQRKDVCTLFPPSKTQGMDVFFGERVFCGILFPTERAIRCASKPQILFHSMKSRVRFDLPRDGVGAVHAPKPRRCRPRNR